jgi:hypothetical protein
MCPLITQMNDLNRAPFCGFSHAVLKFFPYIAFTWIVTKLNGGIYFIRLLRRTAPF